MSAYRMWEVTKIHRGEDDTTLAIELQDPDGWFDANIRWDGLLELHLYHNVPKGETNPDGDQQIDTLHLADLDAFIDRLRELRQVAQDLLDSKQWRSESDEGLYEI
jgi:hypothetical protein